MATHDYIISNGTGSVIRADINNALSAIVSNNSSNSEPATKYAYMWWADTSAGLLKIRNSANDAWITLFELDGTLTLEDGSNSAPAISFRDDTNTGIFSSAADNLDITTGGTTRVNVSSTGINVTGTVTDDGATHDGDVTFTGASANIIFDKSDNALEFADNAKAVFGNSGDLEIFHNASDSVINDAGTGSLKLQLGGATKAEVVSGGFTVTGDVTATNFVGNIDAVDGDFDGTLEADAITVGGVALNTVIAGVTVTNATNATNATTATNITAADESSDTTCFPLFVTAATGDLPPKTGSNLAFNSSSGVLTATGFAGALTGNVTGDISGTAGVATTVTAADESSDTTCFPLFVTAATGNLAPKTGSNLAFNSSTGVMNVGGILFGSDTAAANTIDDYEEGVFTPSLEFGGATTGITYASMRGGSYTKIGRQVTVNFGFTLTSKGSASGDATLAGLPFAVEDLLSSTSVEASGISSFWNDIGTNSANIVFAALGGTSELELRNTVGAEDDTDAMNEGDFDNDTAIRGSITYFTAT
tara:strand:+ start:52 stop:1656 length:1605 start_codon:yes stop_codon:yes gene_type:complete